MAIKIGIAPDSWGVYGSRQAIRTTQNSPSGGAAWTK